MMGDKMHDKICDMRLYFMIYDEMKSMWWNIFIDWMIHERWMKDEWWKMNNEWWKMNDERFDEWWMMNDERWMNCWILIVLPFPCHLSAIAPCHLSAIAPCHHSAIASYYRLLTLSSAIALDHIQCPNLSHRAMLWWSRNKSQWCDDFRSNNNEWEVDLLNDEWWTMNDKMKVSGW